MGWIDPRNLEHQRNRRLGPNAYRFAPGPSGVRMPDCLDGSAVRARAKEAEQEAKARAAAEQEALARSILQVRRDWEELKREITVRRAAAQREAEAARIKSDLAFDRFFRTFKRYAEQQKAGFNPDQSRVPKGTPDGGQWTGDAGKNGGDDRVQSDELSASKKTEIVRQFGKWTARQFISRYCRASINREMPGEFENVTIADIYDIAKGGDARARTCLKLLKEPRFRK